MYDWSKIDLSRPVYEIAEKLGCSKAAVYQARKRLSAGGTTTTTTTTGSSSARKGTEPAPKAASPSGELLYRVRVTLRGMPYRIYRVLVFSADISVAEFAESIVFAMGWDGWHLFGFDRLSEVTSDLEFMGENQPFKLRDLFCEGSSEPFTYDYGACWRHTVKVVKVGTSFATDVPPYCEKGKGCCPPEDGVWEEDFNPEKFDVEEATDALRYVHQKYLDDPDRATRPIEDKVDMMF